LYVRNCQAKLLQGVPNGLYGEGKGLVYTHSNNYVIIYAAF
jgi:hypothetical protein